MSAQEHRVCAACGAHNDPAVAFCWQCYAPFEASVTPAPPLGAVPGPPGPGGTGPMRPGMPGGYQVGGARGPVGVATPPPSGVGIPSPVSTSSSSRGGLVKTIAGLVAFAVAAAAAYLLFLGGGVTMPDSIEGVPRMTSVTAEQFEKGVDEISQEEFGGNGAGAMYGTGPLPQFMVIAADVTSVETTDQLFDALITGATGAGATVDESQAWSGNRNGVEYRCVAVSQPLTGACLWREDGSVGVVMTLDRDVAATRELTFSAHDQIFA
jgi:hypothetical protein